MSQNGVDGMWRVWLNVDDLVWSEKKDFFEKSIEKRVKESVVAETLRQKSFNGMMKKARKNENED